MPKGPKEYTAMMLRALEDNEDNILKDPLEIAVESTVRIVFATGGPHFELCFTVNVDGDMTDCYTAYKDWGTMYKADVPDKLAEKLWEYYEPYI